MTWVGAKNFSRRPLVVVEDHLYHIAEILDILAGERLLDQVTAVCLDRPGPDTARFVGQWLETYPDLQIAAAVEPGTVPASPRLALLAPDVFASAPALAGFLARSLRAGGLLLQDVQLSTLRFIPADRWWESIYLASTVRGMFAAHPPLCRFLSNKRGYAATFGRELMDAGFDPRDVMDKAELAPVVLPTLLSFLARHFPLELELADGRSRLGRTGPDREEVEAALDLVLWEDGAVELGGRQVRGDKHRLSLRPESSETQTWRELLEDRLAGGDGVAVLAVGNRLAPPDAGRAEITNLAARHLHTLRGRLSEEGAIQTVQHAYRLNERLAVGRVRPRA